MSLNEPVTVECPQCGREHEVTIWNSVNVTVDPDLRDSVFAQDLNVLNCTCGCEVQIERDLLYHDMDRRFQVWLKYPDDSGGIHVEGPIVQLAQALDGYRLRIVRSFPELAEKILIFESALDDRCVEVLKVMVDLHFGPEGRDRVDLFFAGVADNSPDGRTLVFVDRAAGDTDNPVTVKHDAYDDIAARLDPDSDRNEWRFVGEAYGRRAAEQFFDPPAPSVWKVFVDDNFHYMDEEERYLVGEFDSREAAVEECRRIVNQSLTSLYEPGMDAAGLFTMYTGFGEDPFVRGPGRGGFSAWSYAKERAAEICAGNADRVATVESTAPGPDPGTASPAQSRLWAKALRLVGLSAACWVATVLVVTLGYLQWEYIDLSWDLASRYLRAWPLVWGFGAMSLYAVALPAVVGFFQRGRGDLTEAVIGVHAILGWLPLMWNYPGTEQVARYSDPWALVVLGFVWTIQLATSLATLQILRQKRRGTAVAS